jgi:hypothetical protein
LPVWNLYYNRLTAVLRDVRFERLFEAVRYVRLLQNAPPYPLGSTYPPSTHRHGLHEIKQQNEEQISANNNEQRTLGSKLGARWIRYELQFCSFTLFSPLGYWCGFGGNILGVKKAMNSKVNSEKLLLQTMKEMETGLFGPHLLSFVSHSSAEELPVGEMAKMCSDHSYQEVFMGSWAQSVSCFCSCWHVWDGRHEMPEMKERSSSTLQCVMEERLTLWLSSYSCMLSWDFCISLLYCKSFNGKNNTSVLPRFNP